MKRLLTPLMLIAVALSYTLQGQAADDRLRYALFPVWQSEGASAKDLTKLRFQLRLDSKQARFILRQGDSATGIGANFPFIVPQGIEVLASKDKRDKWRYIQPTVIALDSGEWPIFINSDEMLYLETNITFFENGLRKISVNGKFKARLVVRILRMDVDGSRFRNAEELRSTIFELALKDGAIVDVKTGPEAFQSEEIGGLGFRERYRNRINDFLPTSPHH